MLMPWWFSLRRQDCQNVPIEKCDTEKQEQCRNVPRQVDVLSLSAWIVRIILHVSLNVKIFDKIALWHFPDNKLKDKTSLIVICSKQQISQPFSLKDKTNRCAEQFKGRFATKYQDNNVEAFQGLYKMSGWCECKYIVILSVVVMIVLKVSKYSLIMW